MKQHRFNAYGPVCGARDGVNAADMEPPEITCRRCWKAPVEPFSLWYTERHNGHLLVTREIPKEWATK